MNFMPNNISIKYLVKKNIDFTVYGMTDKICARRVELFALQICYTDA